MIFIVLLLLQSNSLINPNHSFYFIEDSTFIPENYSEDQRLFDIIQNYSNINETYSENEIFQAFLNAGFLEYQIKSLQYNEIELHSLYKLRFLLIYAFLLKSNILIINLKSFIITTKFKWLNWLEIYIKTYLNDRICFIIYDLNKNKTDNFLDKICTDILY